MHILKNNRTRSRALSLVELLIAMTIIAVIASVATLKFSSTVGPAELQHAAERLMGDLKQVRAQAMKEKTSYRLEIDTATVSYQAIGVNDLHRRSDIKVELNRPPYRISTLTCSFGGDQYVEFNARGTPHKTGTITLTQDTRQTTIQIQSGYEKVVQL